MPTTPVHYGWTVPLFITAEQSLLAAVLLHQDLNFFEYFQAGDRVSSRFPSISHRTRLYPHGSRTRLSLAAVDYRPLLRMD